MGCGDGDEESGVEDTAPKPTGATQVLFPSDCQNGYAEEPASVVVTCADSGVQVKDIQWQSWGAETATGNGTATVNTCDPDCASGTTDDYPEAQLRLTEIESCGSEQRYTKLELTFGGEVPPGSGTTVRESFPCS
jgi:hypothetical protein